MTQSSIPPMKPIIGGEERVAADRALRPGMITQGLEVVAFETGFSEHSKLGRACVAVNFDTSGLYLGPLPCRAGAGDEVIVPSSVFAAIASSATPTGVTLVLTDIPVDDFTPDPASMGASIAEHTKATTLVRSYGHPV